LGLGINSIYKVDCNADGSMNITDLQNKIGESLAKGEVPFFVNATSGTTVLGAFDCITDIHGVIQHYNETMNTKIWLHVDASWGGSVILSNLHKSYLASSHKANSITWNPHKLLGVPLQCSLLLLQDRNILYNTTSLNAEYLYHFDNTNDCNDSSNNMIQYDLGKKTFQCGRKADSFKFWLILRYYGMYGLQERIECAYGNVSYFINTLLQSDNNFILVKSPQFVNVCFWYIPATYRAQYEEDKSIASVITKRIHEVMIRRGNVMMDYSDLPDGTPHFFRLIISSPKITYEHLAYVISEIKSIGDNVVL
jgi:glutamate decarboxylase